MPALPTPGQLNLRAELYQQIATFAASGIPVRKALETLHRSPPSRSFRKPLARLIARLDTGLDFGAQRHLSTHAQSLPADHPAHQLSNQPG